MIVPTLRVGMQPGTLRVPSGAGTRSVPRGIPTRSVGTIYVVAIRYALGPSGLRINTANGGKFSSSDNACP